MVRIEVNKNRVVSQYATGRCVYSKLMNGC